MSTRQKAIVILWVSVVLIGLLMGTSQGFVPYSTTTQDDTEILNAWPHYLYDPAHTGYNPVENTLRPPLNFNWKAKPDGYFLYSAPVATENCVFATFADESDGTGILCAIDKNDGSEVWDECSILGAIGFHSNPVIDDGLIYVATLNTLYAFSLVDGSLIWSLGFAGSLKEATPVVDGNWVYVVEASGSWPNYVLKVYALDKKNGSILRWPPYATDSTSSIYGAPLIVNDALIFSVSLPEEENRLVAINKNIRTQARNFGI